MIDIEQLKALAAKATQGPWENYGFGCIRGGPIQHFARGSGRTQIVMTTGQDWMRESEQDDNARFISAMRNALPDLLALLEEARRMALRLRNIDTREVFDLDHPLRIDARAFLLKFDTKREG